jgi:hypothetical protein
LGLSRKAINKSVTDASPFFLWINDASEHVQKLVLGFYNVQVGLKMLGKLFDNGLFFVESQEPIINQDA